MTKESSGPSSKLDRHCSVSGVARFISSSNIQCPHLTASTRAPCRGNITVIQSYIWVLEEFYFTYTGIQGFDEVLQLSNLKDKRGLRKKTPLHTGMEIVQNMCTINPGTTLQSVEWVYISYNGATLMLSIILVVSQNLISSTMQDAILLEILCTQVTIEYESN